MEMLSSVISPGNAGRRRAAILILCAIVLDVLEAPASDMKRERSWRCWAAEADSDNANTGATRRARDFHMTPISELLCQLGLRGRAKYARSLPESRKHTAEQSQSIIT